MQNDFKEAAGDIELYLEDFKPVDRQIVATTGKWLHDVVMIITWKYFPHYWHFMRGITRWLTLTNASDAGFEVFPDVKLNKLSNK